MDTKEYKEGFDAGWRDAEYGIGPGEQCYDDKPLDWKSGYEEAQEKWAELERK